MEYRPDDLILCNTNNGTERLNEDLKYDELDVYKNCSLSELLSVLIDSFIPKHYNKYVELNVKYGDGCKKYSPGIPHFLRNRPKQIVDILLDKMQRVTEYLSQKLTILLFQLPALKKEQGFARITEHFSVRKINFAPAIATTLSDTECFANIFLLYFSLD